MEFVGKVLEKRKLHRERDPEICMGIPLSDWLHN